MAVAVDYKCPNCNANLKFNPNEQNWHCEYCDSDFSLDELKKNVEKYEKKDVSSDVGEYNVYKCPSCGAEIVTDLNTSATFCVYCKNTAIIKERLTGKFEPLELIPFSKTQEDAIKAFKKVGRKHPLMPSSFSSEKNISEIRGIYIPFWLFTSTSSGGVTFKCERIRHWNSGNYSYTKTDIYEVIKEGEVSFSKVPNDGALKFDDAIMNSIEPFDYSKLVEFNPSYLSGFLAEKYDVESDKARDNAVNRMRESVVNIYANDVKGYNSVSVSSDNIVFPKVDVEYVLLPVYLLNIKYKDEIYTFAMNGESGKIIGNMPVDKKKVVCLFLVSFVVIFLLCVIVFYVFIRERAIW